MIRIIGGKWRGRKLMVPEIPNLRPTPDRVRETLFNWLQPVIWNAYCLDLFAGSGVLGLEALSRGAKQVMFVDEAPQVVAHLNNTLKNLTAENAIVRHGKFPEVLKNIGKEFDIVFLDPPYQADLLIPSCFYLEENDLLSGEAYIYLEANHEISANELPKNWCLLKQKKAGLVFYHLAKRSPLI